MKINVSEYSVRYSSGSGPENRSVVAGSVPMPITVNTKSGLVMPLASNTSSMLIASRSIEVLASASANRSPMNARTDADPEQAGPTLGDRPPRTSPTRSSPWAAG